jgi:signal transduction histidine kinase
MSTLQAFESRRPAVRRDVQRLLEDARYEPIHKMIAEAEWTSIAYAPVVARDKGLGTLTVFYPAGHDPTDADTAFLTTMADQVAVAVDNAQLLGELEGKAALEERHRLARELHDSVSQALFSMSLHARAVQMAMQESGAVPDGPVAQGVAQLRELTQGALAEMRALIFQLRPEALHEEGLSAAVRKHAAAVAAREGLDVRVYAGQDRLPLEEVAEEELFRVVQEAVHNCVKHAHPHHVDIRLAEAAADPGTLVVEVDDDGVGFEPSAPHPGHLGLDTMRERTERLGGRLVVESSTAGSRVRAVVPGVLHPAPSPTTTSDADDGSPQASAQASARVQP